jgi:hypothetical protein
MDSALVGGLIGFGLLVGVFVCTAAYDKCQKKPVLPIFTSASDTEPLLVIRKQHTKLRDIFGRLSVPLAPQPMK